MCEACSVYVISSDFPPTLVPFGLLRAHWQPVTPDSQDEHPGEGEWELQSQSGSEKHVLNFEDFNQSGATY